MPNSSLSWKTLRMWPAVISKPRTKESQASCRITMTITTSQAPSIWQMAESSSLERARKNEHSGKIMTKATQQPASWTLSIKPSHAKTKRRSRRRIYSTSLRKLLKIMSRPSREPWKLMISSMLPSMCCGKSETLRMRLETTPKKPTLLMKKNPFLWNQSSNPGKEQRNNRNSTFSMPSRKKTKTIQMKIELLRLSSTLLHTSPVKEPDKSKTWRSKKPFQVQLQSCIWIFLHNASQSQN